MLSTVVAYPLGDQRQQGGDGARPTKWQPPICIKNIWAKTAVLPARMETDRGTAPRAIASAAYRNGSRMAIAQSRGDHRTVNGHHHAAPPIAAV